MLISIIVPAYRQEKTIKKDISNIHRVLSATPYTFELIVVVDGFLDKTYEKTKPLEKKFTNVKVIGYQTNKGKGYAVRFGMARAKGDFVSFIDAGMDIHPIGVVMLFEHMKWYEADIIVGSKKHPVSRVNYPLLRRIYSWGYHTGVKILFGIKLKDTQTGLKIFKREVLEKVLPRLLVKQFAFDIEVLAVAKHLGFIKIYEAPVNVKWDFAQTTFRKFMFLDTNIRRMLIDTLAIFYRIKILRYYDDGNKRKWVYDKELDMKVNTGELAQ